VLARRGVNPHIRRVMPLSTGRKIPSMNQILLTGAAGIVGTALRPHLARRFGTVLLTDRAEVADLSAGESFRQGDIADLDFITDLARQAEGIVHLAGLVGAPYGFEEVLAPNVIGSHNVFEAARRADVRRVVFASSHHVVGFHRRGAVIDQATPLRPDSEYALSKAYGEAAGAYYADKYGLRVLAIRIGYVGEDLSRERRLRTWVSARDLAQLVEIGLCAEDLWFESVYGVADNPEPFFDNRNAFQLGYRPQDRSTDFARDEAVPGQGADPGSIEDGLVGGGFAAQGFQGDADRVLGRDVSP